MKSGSGSPLSISLIIKQNQLSIEIAGMRRKHYWRILEFRMTRGICLNIHHFSWKASMPWHRPHKCSSRGQPCAARCENVISPHALSMKHQGVCPSMSYETNNNNLINQIVMYRLQNVEARAHKEISIIHRAALSEVRLRGALPSHRYGDKIEALLSLCAHGSGMARNILSSSKVSSFIFNIY